MSVRGGYNKNPRVKKWCLRCSKFEMCLDEYHFVCIKCHWHINQQMPDRVDDDWKFLGCDNTGIHHGDRLTIET